MLLIIFPANKCAVYLNSKMKELEIIASALERFKNAAYNTGTSGSIGIHPLLPSVQPEVYRVKPKKTAGAWYDEDSDEFDEPNKCELTYRLTRGEFLNYASQQRICPYNNNGYNPHGHKDGMYFRTFKEAMQKAKFGWPEKTAICQALAVQIDDRLRTCAPKIIQSYEVFGGQPDVGRFLSGEPQNMLHREESNSKDQKSNRIVKVVLDVNLNAFGWSNDNAEARGAVAMAAIDAIERSGRRAEVWISSGFRAQGTGVEFAVQLKASNEQMDLDSIAFFCLCSDVERRFMFQCAMNMGFDHGFSGMKASDQGDLYIGYMPELASDPTICMIATLELLEKAGMKID